MPVLAAEGTPLRWEGEQSPNAFVSQAGGGYIRRGGRCLSRELKQGINCLLRAAGDGRGRIGIDDHLYSKYAPVCQLGAARAHRHHGTGEIGKG